MMFKTRLVVTETCLLQTSSTDYHLWLWWLKAESPSKHHIIINSRKDASWLDGREKGRQAGGADLNALAFAAHAAGGDDT